VKKLAAYDNVVIYATEKTHLFLKENKVRSAQVYKISEIGMNPNIADLLTRKVFDLIINIPTRAKVKTGREFTDGKLIRKTAVSMGVTLVTDTEVAVMVMENLAKNNGS
jgi:carbamoyl-phosphate synthase large subunit